MREGVKKKKREDTKGKYQGSVGERDADKNQSQASLSRSNKISRDLGGGGGGLTWCLLFQHIRQVRTTHLHTKIILPPWHLHHE